MAFNGEHLFGALVNKAIENNTGGRTLSLKLVDLLLSLKPKIIIFLSPMLLMQKQSLRDGPSTTTNLGPLNSPSLQTSPLQHVGRSPLMKVRQLYVGLCRYVGRSESMTQSPTCSPPGTCLKHGRLRPNFQAAHSPLST